MLLELKPVFTCILFVVISFLIYRKYYLSRTVKPSIRSYLIPIIVAYLLVLVKVKIFPFFIIRYQYEHREAIFNTIPFQSIQTYLDMGAYKKLGGTITQLMPFLLLLVILMPQKLSLLKLSTIGILTSLSLEGIKWALSHLSGYYSRPIDVDNILLNSIGVLLCATLIVLLRKNQKLCNSLHKLIYYPS